MRENIIRDLDEYKNILQRVKIEEAKLASMQLDLSKRLQDRELERMRALAEVSEYVRNHKQP